MESINWGQLVHDADKSAEPPTLGPHVARVVKAEYKPTKGGDPMVNVSWRIIAGVDEGKVVRDRFVFSVSNPNALHFQFGKLRALGIPPESLPQPGPAMTTAFQDKVATITVVQEREYNGVPQYEVGSYAAAPAGFGAATAPPPAAPPAAAPPAAVPPPVAQPAPVPAAAPAVPPAAAAPAPPAVPAAVPPAAPVQQEQAPPPPPAPPAAPVAPAPAAEEAAAAVAAPPPAPPRPF